MSSVARTHIKVDVASASHIVLPPFYPLAAHRTELNVLRLISQLCGLDQQASGSPMPARSASREGFALTAFLSDGVAPLRGSTCHHQRVAVELPPAALQVSVNPTQNTRAKALYERLGYSETNHQAYVDGIYSGMEDWVVDMVKELAND